MKYGKMLGLLAVAVTALMAFAGSAGATELTSPAGTQLGVGAEIKAVAEAPHTKLDGTIAITCSKSEVQVKISEAGGTGTVRGNISTLHFEECGNNTVVVLNPGSLEVHTSALNTGTLTSSGAEITVLTHNLLGTVHCIYRTSGTHIGTLTGSTGKNKTATLDIGSAGIPQVATDGSCKNDAVWTGNYEVTSPDELYVD